MTRSPIWSQQAGRSQPTGPALEALARRIGVSLSPRELTAAVQAGFVQASPPGAGETAPREFRTCPTFALFQTALQHALAMAGSKARILAIGAGAEIPAQNSAYAAEVTAQTFGPEAVIERLEWTGEAPAMTREFDVVVTHSLLHFLFDFETLVEFVSRRIAGRGGWVMAGETNARHWRNPDMTGRALEWRQSRQKRGLAGVKSLLRGALGRWNPRRTPSLEDIVNRYLSQRCDARGRMSLEEIRCVADPYFPDTSSAIPALAHGGIDWEEQLPEMLTGFRREWVGTARAFGKLHPAALPPEWRAVHDGLEKSYPLDGAVFTAFWAKQ